MTRACSIATSSRRTCSSPRPAIFRSRKYSTPVDIWSIGCIFAEMVTGNPLFPGSEDQDQIKRIFEGLGTPKPDNWPGMLELPKYTPDLPQYPGKPWEELVPGLCQAGLTVLAATLIYEHSQR